MLLNVAGIEEESMVDGVGIRYAIFVQGCPHHCEGCHNLHTWHFQDKMLLNTETLIHNIKSNPLLSGVTFSGGEPFMQPEALKEIADEVHEMGLTVWSYTGFTFEQILSDERKKTLLTSVDVLVDGKFELDKKDLSLTFRGSSNQRIIDVKKSLETDTVVLLDLDN